MIKCNLLKGSCVIKVKHLKRGKFITSIDKSKSLSEIDFPCPLKSMATTCDLSLILLADNANESLTNEYHKSDRPS